MKILPLLLKDAYKFDHRRQYVEGTEVIYSNLTARGSRIPGVNKIVSFGTQFLVEEYLIKQFNEEFFQQPKEKVIKAYTRRVNGILGPNGVGTAHLEDLHDLGFLPIELKALPEGSVVPLKVPVLTIKNTLPEFFWVTNFLETLISSVLWHPMTSATIAFEYRKLLQKYANETSDMPDFVQWQGHDFSFRGQTSVESAIVSGAAHLLSFTGTDTIPAVDFLEEYYHANCDKELIGGSVAATEHSVMSLGISDGNEKQTFDRLITQVYPTGIVSIVSDTIDYWKVLTEIITSLKPEIMKRDGKVVIRPDSGDPVKILCGDPEAPEGSVQNKGTVQYLYEVFGGVVNSKGYKQLDSHIGVIYGDSITLDRAKQICEGLKAKGFASTNPVFGIGSYTYQYVTRDTLGFAMKATYGVVNGEPHNIFKDPITDDGVKKSAKGLLAVQKDSEGNYYLLQEVNEDVEQYQNELQTVLINGESFFDKDFNSLSEIRKRLLSNLK